ncbi:hypothetical protein SK128_019656, partial [Halocaridina rubra]
MLKFSVCGSSDLSNGTTLQVEDSILHDHGVDACMNSENKFGIVGKVDRAGQGANKSFLHRGYVSDGSEAYEYYDGRNFSHIICPKLKNQLCDDNKIIILSTDKPSSHEKVGYLCYDTESTQNPTKGTRERTKVPIKYTEEPSYYASPINNHHVSSVPAKVEPLSTYFFGTKPKDSIPRHLFKQGKYKNITKSHEDLRNVDDHLTNLSESHGNSNNNNSESNFIDFYSSGHYTFPRSIRPVINHEYDVPKKVTTLSIHRGHSIKDGYYSLPNSRRVLKEDKEIQVSDEQRKRDKKSSDEQTKRSFSVHDYESYEFAKNTDDKGTLDDALDFKDARGYKLAKDIRKKRGEKEEEKQKRNSITSRCFIKGKLKISKKLKTIKGNENTRENNSSPPPQGEDFTKRLKAMCQQKMEDLFTDFSIRPSSSESRPWYSNFSKLRYGHRPQAVRAKTSLPIGSENIPDGVYVELFPVK